MGRVVAGIALLVIIFSLAFASHAATRNIIALQGRATNATTGQLLSSGNVTLRIFSAQSGGTYTYEENFTNAIFNGTFNVISGNSTDLNLTYNTKYWMELLINNASVIGAGIGSGRQPFYPTSGPKDATEISLSTGGTAEARLDTLSSNITALNLTVGTKFNNTGGNIGGNVNITGYLYVANLSSGTQYSNGTIYLGRTSDGLESIFFDTTEGNNGKFVFSAPTKIAGGSPAITFYDPSDPTNISKQMSIIFNSSNATTPISFTGGVEINGSLNVLGASPATITFGRGSSAQTLQFDPTSQEFAFSGGKIKQDFVNLIRNGGFESFSGGGSWSGDQISATPDGWNLANGTIYQYAPASYFIGTDIFEGYNSLKIDPTSSNNFGKATQNILSYKLQPNKTYSIGVWVKATGNTVAKLNVTGSALLRNFTEQSAEANSAGTWTLLRGQFTTKRNMTANDNIVIELKVSGTGGASNFGFFDAMQLNTGNVLGEYQDAPIREVGDQTIYGGLRLQRTGLGRGGTLTVDKAVRTRQIEFSFNSDPGWGGIDTNYMNDPRYNWGSAYTQGNIFLELSGGYSVRLSSASPTASELNFMLDNPAGPKLGTIAGKSVVVSGLVVENQLSCGKLYTNASGNVLCAADANSGGTVTSITAGAGLSGGTISTSGTIAVINNAILLNAANISAGTF
ncbi:MAG: carbohydrate binding domain-containing protein, partial [Candidatus Aenigmarchaeota archaeon]|nr:carbohydrate binding domain-containing protein [Candidatus Aenigmarchaeota archaeon]